MNERTEGGKGGRMRERGMAGGGRGGCTEGWKGALEPPTEELEGEKKGKS